MIFSNNFQENQKWLTGRPYMALLGAFRVNGIFAPTSRSRMSNIFRDLESLGKVMERSGVVFKKFSLEVV
jgi:hypothetical protein